MEDYHLWLKNNFNDNEDEKNKIITFMYYTFSHV